MKDIFKLGGAIVGVVLFFVVLGHLVGAINFAAYSFYRPAQIAVDREANRQSQQYIETKEQLLLNLVQDLRRLAAQVDVARLEGRDASSLEAQMKATLDRLEHEAQLIPADKVPAPVRDVLAKHGRYL